MVDWLLNSICVPPVRNSSFFISRFAFSYTDELGWRFAPRCDQLVTCRSCGWNRQTFSSTNEQIAIARQESKNKRKSRGVRIKGYCCVSRTFQNIKCRYVQRSDDWRAGRTDGTMRKYSGPEECERFQAPPCRREKLPYDSNGSRGRDVLEESLPWLGMNS